MDIKMEEFILNTVVLMVYVGLIVSVHKYFEMHGYTFFTVMMFLSFAYVKGKIIPFSSVWRQVKLAINKIK